MVELAGVVPFRRSVAVKRTLTVPENLQGEQLSDPVCPSIGEILCLAESLAVLGVMEVEVELF